MGFMNSQSDNYRLNLILKDFQEGKIDKSIIDIRNYLKKFPNDDVGKFNCAIIFEKTKNTSLAIIEYKKIIKKNPQHWQSLTNLYLIYFHQKKFNVSLNLVNQVIKIKSNFQPALRDKAHILYKLNKLDVALNYILLSVKSNPKDFIALNILGMIYTGLQKNELAIKIYKNAIKINPNYFPSYSNISKCLNDTNQIQESIKYLERCLKINPNFTEAINNLANILNRTGQSKKAIDLYLKILKNNKNHPDVNLNIAIAYFFDSQYSKAESYFNVAKKLDGLSDKFNKNYSLFLLFQQKYHEAWRIGGGRLKLQNFTIPGTWISKFKNKIWQGEKIDKNSNILIVKEQGVGDEILNSSIYLEALNYFPNCIIECDHRLLSIFKRSFQSDRIIPHLEISGNEKKLKNINKVIFSLDLPRIFRNSLNDFIKHLGYLTTDIKTNNNINLELNKISNKKKIGITWKSRREILGEDKSINLNSLSPILEMQNDFDFINLQYGDVESDLNDLFAEKKLKLKTIKSVDLYNDFEQISCLLKNLDLFISVSNTTAHLAGALNVPTWLIKPKSNAIFHYWNQPNSICPWYPSIKLIDQNNNLIKNLKEDLVNFFI